MSRDQLQVSRRIAVRLLIWILLGVLLKVAGFLALMNVGFAFESVLAYLAAILIVAGILVVAIALYQFAVSPRP